MDSSGRAVSDVLRPSWPRILAGQPLAKPLQRLSFAEPRESRTGQLAHLGIRVVPGRLKTAGDVGLILWFGVAVAGCAFILLE